MKNWKFLLVMALFIGLPLSASADIIDNVSLKLDASYPAGWINIDGSSSYVYLDYDVSLDGGTWGEAFCVENAESYDNSTNPYTLFSIDSSLDNYGVDADKYMTAAAIADYYINNYSSDADKAGAQIAVWETVFDWGNAFDLGVGSFQTYCGYSDEAENIYNTFMASGMTVGASYTWALAVSPIVDESGTISENTDFQNYLVRYETAAPVPEPATLLLIGSGLLGMGAFRRKKDKV